MPSSTSSSDVAYRTVPERAWALVWVTALLTFAIAITAWELLARSMGHAPGDFDEYTSMGPQWAEERRKLDDPKRSVKVVLLGSSRILWAADLAILETKLGTRPLQLAVAGTPPALLFQSVVEDSAFDGLIVMGVTPFLFNFMDGGAYGEEALRWYAGAAPSERSGHLIHSFLSGQLAFLDDGFKLFELIDHFSDFPEREGVWDLSAGQWKLGRHFEDRQTDLWGPVEKEDSFDNKQILAFWMLGLGRPDPGPDRMAELLDVTVTFYKPLVEKFRARGGEVVFIRMPSSGAYLENDLTSAYRERIWKPMTDAIDAAWINAMDYPELSADLEIPEWSHVSRKSQDAFSERIVPILDSALRQSGQESLEQILSAGEAR